MNYTENYQLNQWDASDYVRREDFNEDNAKIDAAIKATNDSIPQFVTGSYIGVGQSGESSKVTLTLGFCPKLLFVAPENSYAFPSGAVFLYPAKFAFIDNYKLNVIWSETGLSWWSVDNPGSMLNVQDVTYRYLAIR